MISLSKSSNMHSYMHYEWWQICHIRHKYHILSYCTYRLSNPKGTICSRHQIEAISMISLSKSSNMHSYMHYEWWQICHIRHKYHILSYCTYRLSNPKVPFALDTKLKLFRWYLCRNQAICILTCIMNGGKYVISVTNIISCHTVPIGWVIQRYHLL